MESFLFLWSWCSSEFMLGKHWTRRCLGLFPALTFMILSWMAPTGLWKYSSQMMEMKPWMAKQWDRDTLLDGICICRATIQKAPFLIRDVLPAEWAPTVTCIAQAKVTQVTCALHCDSENTSSLRLRGSGVKRIFHPRSRHTEAARTLFTPC